MPLFKGKLGIFAVEKKYVHANLSNGSGYVPFGYVRILINKFKGSLTLDIINIFKTGIIMESINLLV